MRAPSTDVSPTKSRHLKYEPTSSVLRAASNHTRRAQKSAWFLLEDGQVFNDAYVPLVYCLLNKALREFIRDEAQEAMAEKGLSKVKIFAGLGDALVAFLGN
jgi:hypothetical protein